MWLRFCFFARTSWKQKLVVKKSKSQATELQIVVLYLPKKKKNCRVININNTWFKLWYKTRYVNFRSKLDAYSLLMTYKEHNPTSYLLPPYYIYVRIYPYCFFHFQDSIGLSLIKTLSKKTSVIPRKSKEKGLIIKSHNPTTISTLYQISRGEKS